MGRLSYAQMQRLYDKIGEERFENLRNNLLSDIGYYPTPPDWGAEGNKKIFVGKRLTAGEVDDYLRNARSQSHLVGTVSNLIADFCWRESMQRLKDAGLYRMGVKKACNDVEREIKAWKGEIKYQLGNHYETAEIFFAERFEELMPLFESLRLQIANSLGKHTKRTELASWVEITQQMFAMSHTVWKCVREAWKTQGVDVGDVISHMDLQPRCCKNWEKVCMSLYSYEAQIECTKDECCERALKIWGRSAVSIDGLMPHLRNSAYETREYYTDEQMASLEEDWEYLQQKKRKEDEEQKRKEQEYLRTRRKQKVKRTATDITEEDLNGLIKHFSA